MPELTVSEELARILNITPPEEKFDSEVIVEAIRSFCDLRGLDERSTRTCVAAGLNPYWVESRSVAWCVSVGCQKAFRMFPRTGP